MWARHRSESDERVERLNVLSHGRASAPLKSVSDAGPWVPQLPGLSWVVVLLLLLACLVTERYAKAAPEPWHVAYAAIDTSDFEFRHPMTVIDQAELEVAKARVAAGIYPQAAVFPFLIRDAEAAQSFTPDPPATMEIMAGYAANSNLEEMREWLWRNRTAAYTSALAYAYTGEDKYAEKAVEILNAWAEKGTTFTGYDRGLQLASWFSGMLYAADLIYDYPGWRHEDRERFKDWWRESVLPHTRQIMYERSNNWKDAGILGVLAAAVVLEDRELLREGLVELTSYFYERVDESVVHKGLWKIRRDGDVVYLPKEVVRNEGVSGVTYTGYALTSAVQALEIARYAGYNLWHHETPQGVTFQDVIEWYFRWDVLAEPFPWHANPNRGRTRKNPYEIANNHYALMPEITEWLLWNRPVDGRQGDEYATLNKGDMPPVTNPGSGMRLAVLSEYDGLYSVRFVGRDIELTLVPEAELPRHLVLNLAHVDAVQIAPDGPDLPFSLGGHTVRVELPRDLEPPVRMRLVGAVGQVTGIRTVALVGIADGVLFGPVEAQVAVETQPADLPVERIAVRLGDRLLYDGSKAPAAFRLNEGELSDGLYELVVTVVPPEPLRPVERHIPVAVANTRLASHSHGDVVSSVIAIRALSALPDAAIARSRVELSALDSDEVVTVWEGDGPPAAAWFDTRQVADGRYRLRVETVTRQGAVSEAVAEVIVRNGWELVDPLDAPQIFFGSVWDRSLTVRKSDGWAHATDNPQHFFGDEGRMVRKDATEEELVWETPYLRNVRITLYSRGEAVDSTLELTVSADGEKWSALAYDAASGERSAAGWQKVTVHAAVDNPDDVRFFRLTLRGGAVAPDALQIGEVVLEGR